MNISLRYTKLLVAFFICYNLSAQETNNSIDGTITIDSLTDSLKNKVESELNHLKEKNKNTLKIISISPTANLKHNETYTFTVIVVYNLVTNPQGILNIGYNCEETPESYRLITEISKIIDKGYGYHIFQLRAKAIDLSPNGNAFYISTNLSEYPHPMRWSPLASDRFFLKVN